jgi:hypothetical protein
MRIMRGLGIRDIKSGRMPVTTKSAQGTGGRPILVGCRFEAVAPNLLPVVDTTYVCIVSGSFGYAAFAATSSSGRAPPP